MLTKNVNYAHLLPTTTNGAEIPEPKSWGWQGLSTVPENLEFAEAEAVARGQMEMEVPT